MIRRVMFRLLCRWDAWFDQGLVDEEEDEE